MGNMTKSSLERAQNSVKESLLEQFKPKTKASLEFTAQNQLKLNGKLFTIAPISFTSHEETQAKLCDKHQRMWHVAKIISLSLFLACLLPVMLSLAAPGLLPSSLHLILPLASVIPMAFCITSQVKSWNILKARAVLVNEYKIRAYEESVKVFNDIIRQYEADRQASTSSSSTTSTGSLTEKEIALMSPVPPTPPTPTPVPKTEHAERVSSVSTSPVSPSAPAGESVLPAIPASTFPVTPTMIVPSTVSASPAPAPDLSLTPSAPTPIVVATSPPTPSVLPPPPVKEPDSPVTVTSPVVSTVTSPLPVRTPTPAPDASSTSLAPAPIIVTIPTPTPPIGPSFTTKSFSPLSPKPPEASPLILTSLFTEERLRTPNPDFSLPKELELPSPSPSRCYEGPVSQAFGVLRSGFLFKEGSWGNTSLPLFLHFISHWAWDEPFKKVLIELLQQAHSIDKEYADILYERAVSTAIEEVFSKNKPVLLRLSVFGHQYHKQKAPWERRWESDDHTHTVYMYIEKTDKDNAKVRLFGMDTGPSHLAASRQQKVSRNIELLGVKRTSLLGIVSTISKKRSRSNVPKYGEESFEDFIEQLSPSERHYSQSTLPKLGSNRSSFISLMNVIHFFCQREGEKPGGDTAYYAIVFQKLQLFYLTWLLNLAIKSNKEGYQAIDLETRAFFLNAFKIACKTAKCAEKWQREDAYLLVNALTNIEKAQTLIQGHHTRNIKLFKLYEGSISSPSPFPKPILEEPKIKERRVPDDEIAFYYLQFSNMLDQPLNDSLDLIFQIASSLSKEKKELQKEFSFALEGFIIKFFKKYIKGSTSWGEGFNRDQAQKLIKSLDKMAVVYMMTLQFRDDGFMLESLVNMQIALPIAVLHAIQLRLVDKCLKKSSSTINAKDLVYCELSRIENFLLTFGPESLWKDIKECISIGVDCPKNGTPFVITDSVSVALPKKLYEASFSFFTNEISKPAGGAKSDKEIRQNNCRFLIASTRTESSKGSQLPYWGKALLNTAIFIQYILRINKDRLLNSTSSSFDLSLRDLGPEQHLEVLVGNKPIYLCRSLHEDYGAAYRQARDTAEKHVYPLCSGEKENSINASLPEPPWKGMIDCTQLNRTGLSLLERSLAYMDLMLAVDKKDKIERTEIMDLLVGHLWLNQSVLANPSCGALPSKYFWPLAEAARRRIFAKHAYEIKRYLQSSRNVALLMEKVAELLNWPRGLIWTVYKNKTKEGLDYITKIESTNTSCSMDPITYIFFPMQGKMEMSKGDRFLLPHDIATDPEFIKLFPNIVWACERELDERTSAYVYRFVDSHGIPTAVRKISKAVEIEQIDRSKNLLYVSTESNLYKLEIAKALKNCPLLHDCTYWWDVQEKEILFRDRENVFRYRAKQVRFYGNLSSSGRDVLAISRLEGNLVLANEVFCFSHLDYPLGCFAAPHPHYIWIKKDCDLSWSFDRAIEFEELFSIELPHFGLSFKKVLKGRTLFVESDQFPGYFLTIGCDVGGGPEPWAETQRYLKLTDGNEKTIILMPKMNCGRQSPLPYCIYDLNGEKLKGRTPVDDLHLAIVFAQGEHYEDLATILRKFGNLHRPLALEETEILLFLFDRKDTDVNYLMIQLFIGYLLLQSKQLSKELMDKEFTDKLAFYLQDYLSRDDRGHVLPLSLFESNYIIKYLIETGCFKCTVPMADECDPTVSFLLSLKKLSAEWSCLKCDLTFTNLPIPLSLRSEDYRYDALDLEITSQEISQETLELFEKELGSRVKNSSDEIDRLEEKIKKILEKINANFEKESKEKEERSVQEQLHQLQGGVYHLSLDELIIAFGRGLETLVVTHLVPEEYIHVLQSLIATWLFQKARWGHLMAINFAREEAANSTDTERKGWLEVMMGLLNNEKTFKVDCSEESQRAFRLHLIAEANERSIPDLIS